MNSQPYLSEDELDTESPEVEVPSKKPSLDEDVDDESALDEEPLEIDEEE